MKTNEIKNNLDKLILLDSSAIIHRAYHGLPPLTTHDGVLVNAVYGFATTLFKVLEEFKPKYIVACFDVKGPTVRHAEFKEYKAHRPPPPDDLIPQFQYVREVCKVLNVPVISLQGYEADDVIGTIVEKIRNSKLEARNKFEIKNSNFQNDPKLKAYGLQLMTIIVTGDMDTLQLIDENTVVYSMSRGIKRAEIYDADAVKEKYGFLPNQMVDYKALRGDPSDNIPGVPGIGEVTATLLIQNFGSLENLYKHIQNPKHEIRNKSKIQNSNISKLNENLKFKIKNLLIKYKDQAYLSKKLATIIKDVPIEFKLSDCLVHDYDKRQAEKLFKKLDFKSLINRLPKEEKNHSQSSLFNL